MSRTTKEPSYVKQFGPNLAISSANETGTGGEEAYKMYSVNLQEDVALFSFAENGTFRWHCDKSMEIDAGITGDGGLDMMFLCHNGSYQVTAENGTIVLKAENIVLDASEGVLIKAKKFTHKSKDYVAKATNAKSSFSRGSWQSNRKLLPGSASSFSGSAFKGSRVSKETLLTKAPNVL